MEKLPDLHPAPAAADRDEFDLEKALTEAGGEEEPQTEGKIHISETVVLDLARRSLSKVPSVLPANSGSSVLGIGRKNNDGIKVVIEERKGKEPTIVLDAYVQMRWGCRIPDVAWDVQELLKNDLEEMTGYEVRAVNIHVQGIYFEDKTPADSDSPAQAATVNPVKEKEDKAGSP